MRALPGRARTASQPSLSFPVVGIGASAGGLEAFTRLLQSLPQNTGMAFVLVQHLDPKHPSMLGEILRRSTSLPLEEARDGMRILPDHVYVVPANADIALRNGSLRVEPRGKEGGRQHLAIDHFFLSLADRCKSRAIGVVLSGTLSDGALGLRAIKAEGGVTFAQDQESAKFPDMPRAAIAAGGVDFVAAPEEIARELIRMGAHPYLRDAEASHEEVPAQSLPQADHSQTLALLRKATGVDFSSYRQTTIQRRIARRMAVNKVETAEEYLQVLRKKRDEVHALYEDILITVTSFFRDPDTFHTLKTRIFKPLLRDRPSATPVRIWVPGCSTGEEVYSIAICLFEALDTVDVPPPIQIFGTDISETAVEKARAGLYQENSMTDVSPERRKRFFVKIEAGWRVSRGVRDVCVFARQDITVDPPFSNLDLVSCRNLLIYLESVLQKRVVPLFHYALRPNGFLMLGNAETIATFDDLFTPIDRKHRIFAKRAAISRPRIEFGRLQPEQDRQAEETAAPAQSGPADLQKDADRHVLGRYGPPGVLVNDRYDVVQFRGRTSPFLEAPSGAANFNVLKMAREGLLVDLRAALQKARKTNKAVRAEGLHVKPDGRFQKVDLEVVPLRRDAPGGRHFLVLFEKPDRKRRDVPASGSRAPSPGASQEAIVKLEQDLTATKEYLQSIIEDQESSNEELKSAQEEMLSSNEELRSTNEELETAKEELQSSNEELTTVNEELHNRNIELTQVNSDLLNLLAGTTLAIVMLDADGRLRRFTPQAETLLNLIPSDIGRKIREIRPNLQIPDLEEIIMDAIEKARGHEREVQDREGRWYLMRAQPYRTTDQRVDGAVIAFIDIERLKHSLDEIGAARDYAEALVETLHEAFVVLDSSLLVRGANQAFFRLFRRGAPQTQGRPMNELWDLGDSGPDLIARIERTAREDAPMRDFELRLDIDGERKTLLFNATRVVLPGEAQPVVLLAIEDITERKAVETALRASEAQYRLIFETAREGIWLMDAASGRLLDVNPFLLDLLGYAREELVGKRPWEIGLYENGETARSRFEANLAGDFGFEQEASLRTKSGQTVYVEAISNTYRLGDRLVTQANLRDVTERTKLQDQVRQMQKLDSIGRLAGGVAHDFNNLLNIILAHSALLAREGLPADKRAESANSIEKAVERGSAVVKQLLTFARKTEVSFEPTDVNALVEELATMLRETFQRQIKVQTKLADNVPSFHADANQLHQAVLNLAFNARDAMPQGGVLTIGTDAVAGETVRAKFPEATADLYVEVCVSDNGMGMDAETRRRIFEPFFTTKGAKGQGLGLAVVYGIVNAHRGWIDLETETGKGTTFRLYFAVSGPVAAGGGAPPEGRRREARQLTAPRRDTAARVLLVVEDEEMLLQPVRALLEENGYEVLTAADGVEAVRCFEENAHRISAVLLDLGLPRLGGWEAFLKMRVLDPTVRCIVASGNLDADQRSEMMKEGVQASVRKPYTSAQILTVVRAVLN